MKLLDKLAHYLSLAERSALVALVFFMVALSFLQVVLRNAFSLGILWADPLLRTMVMWVGFLGAVLATKEEKHFRIDLLERYLTPRSRHVVRVFLELSAVVVTYLLTRAAWQFLIEGIGPEEKDLFDIPRRVYFVILPAGFGLMAVHSLLNAIAHLAGFLRPAALPADRTHRHPDGVV